MQAMKCEICGSNDIVKQEGFFACQHCGTKYSVEEARKLIGTVKIDKSDENEKYLILARRARDEENPDSCIKYYSLVAENDPQNWEAAFFVPYYQFVNNTTNETSSAFNNALKTAFPLMESQIKPDDMDKAARAICNAAYDGCYLAHKNNAYHFFVEPCEKELRDFFKRDDLADKVKDKHASIDKLEDDAFQYQMNQFNREYASFKRSSGGCYIATCVYGSYDCPQVWTLRRFRDNTLAATWYGRAFIRIYYAISPKLVTLFGNTSWFKRLWRGRLDNLVVHLRKNGISDNPYTDK